MSVDCSISGYSSRPPSWSNAMIRMGWDHYEVILKMAGSEVVLTTVTNDNEYWRNEAQSLAAYAG
ncbi:MAG: hypothetical protein QNL91_01195 [Candidatus Krumholzibacteria bacterium]|nr:hypothetical protein [Candidatus Krumholzibacteria bacterium]